MNTLRLEAGGGARRAIRRAVALVTIGAAGRVLWYAAVDAFILHFFGNPSPSPRSNRRHPAGPAPVRGTGAKAEWPAPSGLTADNRPPVRRVA